MPVWIQSTLCLLCILVQLQESHLMQLREYTYGIILSKYIYLFLYCISCFNLLKAGWQVFPTWLHAMVKWHYVGAVMSKRQFNTDINLFWYSVRRGYIPFGGLAWEVNMLTHWSQAVSKPYLAALQRNSYVFSSQFLFSSKRKRR